jgi:predicted dehydrogenase
MKVRFGVVGTAYWAAAVHTVGLGAVPNAQLAGIWGRDQAKARALAAERGTIAFTTFDEMLSSVDAVSFAVPPRVQEELALRAIAAGKHVLLEKPIATTHRRAVEIAQAVARSGVASLVFFTRRFVPAVAAEIERQAGRRWCGRKSRCARRPSPQAAPTRTRPGGTPMARRSGTSALMCSRY